MELSDTMHGTPMQIGQPNGVRSSDWLGYINLKFPNILVLLAHQFCMLVQKVFLLFHYVE